MLIARALAAATTIAGIWLIGIPALVFAVWPESWAGQATWLRLLGAVPLAGGAALFAWVTWVLATAGGGTAIVFDPPARLVRGGPYRWIRNPMYAGDFLILIGEAVVLESTAVLAYAALFWLALHVITVVYEEPRLQARFASAYGEYCRAVPRWIPRLSAAARPPT